MSVLNFASDNVGPAAPEVMTALADANAAAHMPYGADRFTDRAEALVREVLEAPEAAVHLVATGTAANALALATLTQPWQAIFCHHAAHVELDEAGAVEFYSAGAKLRLVPGASGKMSPEALLAVIDGVPEGDVSSVQRGPVTLAQLTEAGTAYTVTEITALTAVAHARGLKVHMDGARIANAIAAATCTPAEMITSAGIDALSLGGTKNGCLGVEAVVILDPEKAWELSMRRKRAGQTWSKHRFLGAQMAAYLKNGLWLDLAARANAAMAVLLEGLSEMPEARLADSPGGNVAFLDLPAAMHRRAHAAGAQYYLFDADGPDVPEDAPLRCRIVCDWSKTDEDVAALLALWRSS
ncbi:MAG: beta-eliminating lyase-related protein [Pseudomonadota bacterium]